MTDANKAALDAFKEAKSHLQGSFRYDKLPDYEFMMSRLEIVDRFLTTPAANTGDDLPFAFEIRNHNNRPHMFFTVDGGDREPTLQEIAMWNHIKSLAALAPRQVADFDKFVEMLDREPQYRPRLAALLQEHAPRQVDETKLDRALKSVEGAPLSISWGMIDMLVKGRSGHIIEIIKAARLYQRNLIGNAQGRG